MNYEYASIPTRYRNTNFRSRLEARWAAFADLAGWQWRYEPIDLDGWIPDFWFAVPRCWECSNHRHELYAEVKPYRTLAEFDGHPVTRIDPSSIPSPAKFGWHPEVTEWTMHGSMTGVIWIWETDQGVEAALDDNEKLWAEAGNLTRWRA